MKKLIVLKNMLYLLICISMNWLNTHPDVCQCTYIVYQLMSLCDDNIILQLAIIFFMLFC